jgi:hypothetical protein
MENIKRKPNWSEKEKLMLVKEVNDREGRLFGKFSGVGAKGTKLKGLNISFLVTKVKGFNISFSVRQK